MVTQTVLEMRKCQKLATLIFEGHRLEMRKWQKLTLVKQYYSSNSLPLGLCLKVIDEGLSVVNWKYLFRNNFGTFFYG
ncbi:hypothetical protein C0J52_02594 [Blattella germanica]|nr:hypothetical protein C0J52_02594 [Blattella germanica]